MTDADQSSDLSTELMTQVPYLRRYARALTGSQDSGDRYALAALDVVVNDPAALGQAPTVKLGLFRAFHSIWSSSGATVDDADTGGDLIEARAQWRLRGLSPNTREALLLNTIERFSAADVAWIMQIDHPEAQQLIETARREMADQVLGKVMIIEDEAITAMDLEGIVASMGHTVTGIARTRDGAVQLGAQDTPELILADIQLADKSSGIDAVNDLLASLGDRPVVFITAFPERLLTGERPEPAFLITKPYAEEQVRAAVSQAMFFASSAVLNETA